MDELLREVVGWRNHWKTSSFFKAIVFSFAFSLLDTATDFNFAWNVQTDCPLDGDFFAMASSPCGFILAKRAEFFTYTFIAAPGILFFISAASSLLKGLICKCCGQKVPEFLALFANMCLCFGLYLAATFYVFWTPLFPSVRLHYPSTCLPLSHLDRGSEVPRTYQSWTRN